MANEIPQMSLKQATLAQGSFTPIVYTPQTEDFSLLQKSLAQMEARQEKASEQQTAVDLVLGETEDKLNAAELPWFNEYKQNIKKQIQDEVDAGNYGSAIRVATRLAGKVKSDTQLKNRIKQNANYQEALKTVKANTNLSKDTKDWWIDTHKYSYNDEEGVTDYNDLPADPVDLVSLSAKAIQLTAPEKYSNTKETSSHKGSQNDITNADGTGKGSSYSTTTSHGESISEQWLDEKKLKEVMDRVFAGTKGAKEAIIQDRRVSIWKLSKLKEEYDNPNTTPERRAEINSESKLYEDDVYDKGVLMGEDEYIAKKVNPILHNAAYHHKDRRVSNSYSHDSGSRIDNAAKGGGSYAGNPGNGIVVPGMPKGLEFPLRLTQGGVVNIPWGDYGDHAKKEAADAAENAWYVLTNPTNVPKQTKH